jgi:hypothetical protein
VVDRWHRKEYLAALDSANAGALRDLILLFVKLEASALTSERERPPEPSSGGLAIEVAHTLAAQLAEPRRRQQTERQQRVSARAIAVGGRVREWFERKRTELHEAFRARGITDVDVTADTAMPPSSKTHWFRRQIIRSAEVAGHYADLKTFAGWSSLRIRTDRWLLRYVASLHGAGREPGIVAVTTFAEIEPYPTEGADSQGETREYINTTSDAFRFVHSEPIAEIDQRATELEELLDQGLAAALAGLLRKSQDTT